jgi:hypothetical protein
MRWAAFIVVLACGCGPQNSEGGTDSSTTEGSSTTEDSATSGAASMSGGDTMTTSTTDPTGDATGDATGGMAGYDAFLPVLAIIQANCDDGSSTCHRNGGPYPPLLDDEVAYDNLFMESLTGSPMPYVTPNDPTQSYVMVRLQLPESDVQSMPYLLPSLSQADLDTITDWINGGAAR